MFGQNIDLFQDISPTLLKQRSWNLSYSPIQRLYIAIRDTHVYAKNKEYVTAKSGLVEVNVNVYTKDVEQYLV